MKKTLCFLYVMAFSVCLLNAKISLIFDAGPIYTHFSNHLSLNDGTKYTRSANLGGVNFLLRGEFAKNFGVYGMANFAFGQGQWIRTYRQNYSKNVHSSIDLSYAIDSQFGFFYGIKPVKNLEIMIGIGFGLGGNGFNRSYTVNKTQKSNKLHCTNIGGGFNVDVSYMLTKMIGIYGGLCDTMYAPVSAISNEKDGDQSNIETFTGSNVQSGGVGRFSNSFSLKAGIQIQF